MRWWLPLLLAACSKPKTDVSIKPEPSLEPPKKKATAPAPGALPVCKTNDPLNAICRLGDDASKARFECDNPEPIMFCKKGDKWCCKYLSFAGEKVPAVSFEARFDSHGPEVKSGDMLDMKLFKREGPVRAVSIHFEEKDEKAGKKRADAFADGILGWGCTEGEKGYKRTFDCGSWEASVKYNDITHLVYVEAAQTGYSECE